MAEAFQYGNRDFSADPALSLVKTGTDEEPDEFSVQQETNEDLDITDTMFDQLLAIEHISIDDPIRMYLREIGRTPLLTGPRELELTKTLGDGREKFKELVDRFFLEIKFDPEFMLDADDQALLTEVGGARAHLIEANLRLVVSVAKKYTSQGLGLLDLIQEGNTGLMRAIDRFDYKRGYKVSTYATWWIRQAITRAIADQGRTIRLPVHKNEEIARMIKASRDLEQKLGREPNQDDLATRLGIPRERVQLLMIEQEYALSLETPVGSKEGDEEPLGHFIEDKKTTDMTESASQNILKEKVEELLSGLTARERRVISMRFGLEDDHPLTLEEAGKELEVTRERIRQIEKAILRKWRETEEIEQLREYLE